MSIHRRAARRDQNESTIVSAFEARGWTVVKLSGKGLPDLLCMRAPTRLTAIGIFGGPRYLLVDVKMPKGTFKPAQVETWRTWSERGLPVYVAVTAEDVLAIIHGAAAPWGTMEAAPRRGKALAKVEVDAGMRLRVTLEPGSGLIRAPRQKVAHGETEARAIDRRFNASLKQRRAAEGMALEIRAGKRMENGYPKPGHNPPATSAAHLAEETFAPSEPCWHSPGFHSPGPCRKNTPECRS